MLSNTAVPKYHGEFRDAVIAGEIPVNQNVSMEMNRIDYLIDNPDFYYDDEAVERWIRFCENEMVLTDGSDLVLLDSFKLWAEQVFGWYYFIEIKVWDPDAHGAGRGGYVTKQKKKRLINKQYLIVGRGAAKSLYDSCMQGYFLNCDVSTTDQIVTAPTMRMSEEIVNPIATAITKARGDLFKFLTEGSLQNTTGSKKDRQKLASTKKGIQNFLTNSVIRILPMSIDKLQGLRCKIATVDEWLSGVIKEDPIGAIEQGASKLDDYLIIATSSEGTVRNGAGDAMKIELMKILKGEYYNPHVSIWWYRLDDISEVADPFMWVKANPNIGKTVTYETYQLDVERAENSPSARNDIIAKRFGIPMEGFTFFFTYEETICHGRQSYDGMQCAMGADLSQGGDFCSFAFLFPLSNGAFGVKTINYISEYTMSTLNMAMRQKYESFQREGTLVVMPGTILKMDDVYDDLDEYIQKHEYDIRAFGYDPYNSVEFVTRWIRENGEWGVQKVIQGAKTESVPLTEIKKLVEQRIWLFDEELYSYTMGNCMILMDTNGNKKLLKQVYEAKIDAVAASMDAFVAYKINVDSFD
jgi:phage terminase large subunit-like protein